MSPIPHEGGGTHVEISVEIGITVETTIDLQLYYQRPASSTLLWLGCFLFPFDQPPFPSSRTSDHVERFTISMLQFSPSSFHRCISFRASFCYQVFSSIRTAGSLSSRQRGYSLVSLRSPHFPPTRKVPIGRIACKLGVPCNSSKRPLPDTELR